MAKQPETKVKFSIFNKEFNEGISEINKKSTTLRKEFKLQEEQLKENGSATDILQNKIKRLSGEQDLTKQKIKATAEQLAKAKSYYGENSNEANKLSNKLLDLQISEQKMSNAIKQAKSDIHKQSQEMVSAVKDAKSLSSALDEVSDKAKDAGGNLSAGVSLPLGGIGVAAGKTAVDIDGAVRLMIGALGKTGEEAKLLESDLRAVWSEGFGENPEEAARAMMMVKQNIQGINEGKPLQEVTKDALTLAKVTEADVSEVTRGVNQLMHNFGLTSKEAMDLFAKGQAEGLNFSQEMFDNISEYAPLFKQMGFSASEYFTVLANGSQNGAYNLDYINDVMKEFDIRMRDGSKTTADAFKSMSQNSQNMFQKFKDGKVTTQELFNTVLPELEKMDDQVLANQIGVGLFGTKFENLGTKTVYALNDVNTSLDNTKGAIDQLGSTQVESLGTQLQSAMRSIGQALEPIGVILVGMLLSLKPYLEQFSAWFQTLAPSIQQVIVVLGILITLLGPLITIFGFFVQGLMPLIPILTTVWGWLSKLGPLFNILRMAMLAITGPVGIVIAVIAALVTAIVILWKKNESFRNFFINLWNNLSLVFKLLITQMQSVAISIFTFLVRFFRKWGVTVLSVITGPIGALVIYVIQNFEDIRAKAVSIFNRVHSAITNPIQSAKDKVLGIISVIKSAFSNMKITIPKPKLPKVDISKGIKTIAGIDIPYPKFNVTWHKTGGVFTKPVVAGNAGFGDVEEGIVPFEGPHAMKIAKLIAEAQNKIAEASNQVVDKVISNLISVNVEAGDVIMDGRAVGKIVWKPVKQEIDSNEQRP
ncbi:phage tail tape measure protein [Rossellomorea sp. DUT-2]|uniref:phage tail tape measure protein n=1 Tax=Rossellomorea sp. DUT-2 TaxID=3412021 RepID=UPI003D172767